MNKILLNTVLALFSLVITGLSLNAQTLSQGSTELDNRLYNGKYYNYFLPSNVTGNQFLTTKDNSIGIVWGNGVEFENLLLNYDVLNQQLLLEFITNEKATRLISLSMVNVDSFYFENKIFVIDTNISKLHNIYQCISYNGIKIYLHLYKFMNLQSKLNDIEYNFTKLQRDIYFFDKGEYLKVKNNSKFIKILNPQISKNVKRYMKSKKYKLKRMTDNQYLDLLIYIKDKARE